METSEGDGSVSSPSVFARVSCVALTLLTLFSNPANCFMKSRMVGISSGLAGRISTSAFISEWKGGRINGGSASPYIAKHVILSFEQLTCVKAETGSNLFSKVIYFRLSSTAIGQEVHVILPGWPVPPRIEAINQPPVHSPPVFERSAIQTAHLQSAGR